MFASARKAVEILFDPVFFGVVLKALALTIGLFVLLFLGLEYCIHWLIAVYPQWSGGFITAIATFLFVLLAYVLGAPVAALFAALFLDDIARAIEAKSYPVDPLAPGAPFWHALLSGLRLFGWTLILGILLLPLNLLLPGIGALLSLLVSGWLLGREYFELAALRHISWKSATSLRRRHPLAILAGGLLIALLAAIPFIDLFAPVLGVALMVHEFKRLAKGNSNEVE
ncbi:MAG TPA: EI24 domain-containing protein [Rhizomicrobium sp.]|jgi:CysZ protein|nr:EI24 domain-containing protein [Rhizomicrobium sp.]